ncbi:MAG: hypothetical protein GY945_14585 [Rhodobacteraceae bacterium]|nr:hypothetical protein [Paracoccaceae bacterium]
MSNPEHFIDEVTEELRRDRLFALMRKYGWIAILAVLLIVGGAAYNEWRKAGERAKAEALGDAMTAALQQSDPAARAAGLAAIEAEGDARAMVAFMAALGGAEGVDEATLAGLRELAEDSDLARIYRDLAVLKLISVSEMEPAERVTLLTPLTTAGAPYRALAEEQMALAEVESGEVEAAITRLQALLQDDDASQVLRARALQLIVALGATPET